MYDPSAVLICLNEKLHVPIPDRYQYFDNLVEDKTMLLQMLLSSVGAHEITLHYQLDSLSLHLAYIITSKEVSTTTALNKT
uniref:Uncharacterized protein n=1 Tax=Solanum lycopersicum TaxID=4081 RepID=A0A3Q7EVQ0_SOLLC